MSVLKSVKLLKLIINTCIVDGRVTTFGFLPLTSVIGHTD